MGLANKIISNESAALEVLHSLDGDSSLSTDEKIDRLELWMCGNGLLVDLETYHVFTPGLVSRTIFMPKGTFLTSRIHRHDHQYAIVSGACSVFIDGVGVEYLEAPYVGTTKSGSRRVLYIHEDTVWVTFHPSQTLTVEDFEAEAFEDRKILGDLTSHQLHLSITEELRAAIESGELKELVA